MKDPVHHLKSVQKKVIRSLRKEESSKDNENGHAKINGQSNDTVLKLGLKRQ